MESPSYAVRDTRFPANLDSSDCKYWTLNLDGTRSCPSATPKLPLRPVVHRRTDLLTSQSVMKRMSQAEQLPKFEKMGAKNAKLRSLLRVVRPPSGTVSKTYGAIALSLRVGAHEHYLVEQNRASCFLAADVPQDAFALLRSSHSAIHLAGRRAFREQI